MLLVLIVAFYPLLIVSKCCLSTNSHPYNVTISILVWAFMTRYFEDISKYWGLNCIQILWNHFKVILCVKSPPLTSLSLLPYSVIMKQYIKPGVLPLSVSSGTSSHVFSKSSGSFTGSLEPVGLHASSHGILAVWWPTAGHNLHHRHMPQCWTISRLFVCFLPSSPSSWFPSSYIFPSLFVFLTHCPPISVSHAHIRPGDNTLHSYLSPCLLSISVYTFTHRLSTHSTDAPFKQHSSWLWKCVNPFGPVHVLTTS